MGRSHGMLFSTPMVLALLAGTKTQTRRIITPRNSLFDGGSVKKKLWDLLDWSRAYIDKGPSPAGNPGPYWHVPYKTDDEYWARIYPRILPGDEIWVKETFATKCAEGKTKVPYFRADPYTEGFPAGIKWTASILMPRKASRIALAVSTVRTERIQDISETDAASEGVPKKLWITSPLSAGAMGARGVRGTHRDSYRTLWGKINGIASWKSNPPVWVYDFSRN